jgi:hypothetical protein
MAPDLATKQVSHVLRVVRVAVRGDATVTDGRFTALRPGSQRTRPGRRCA